MSRTKKAIDWTDVQRAQIKASRDADVSWDVIAEQFGVTRTAVIDCARKMGIKPKTVAYKPRELVSRTPEREDELRRLVAAGKTSREIAPLMGISVGTVTEWRSRLQLGKPEPVAVVDDRPEGARRDRNSRPLSPGDHLAWSIINAGLPLLESDPYPVTLGHFRRA